MYKLIWPEQDSTIYSNFPLKNTGADEMLELTKILPNTLKDVQPGVSRILIKFNLNDLISDYNKENFKAILTLNTARATSLNTNYTLEVAPISGSWDNGNGYFNNIPEVRSGVSWDRRNYSNDLWNSPGGDIHNNDIISKNYILEDSDINIDVTNIVLNWISGSYNNDGFLIKFSDSNETNNTPYGSLQLFSRETHTIFIPNLKLFWSSNNEYTGSFNSVNHNDYRIFIPNLKSKYYVNEKHRLRIGVVEKYNAQSYTKRQTENLIKTVNGNLLFSIVDTVTRLPVVPFSEVGTFVNLDENGYYIDLDLSNFLPVRYYTIIFKEVSEYNTIIHDNNFNFKVQK